MANSALIEITHDVANDAAILEYQERVHSGDWPLYRVCRIYS